MRFGRYQFRCTFQDDAVLPAYKGSTFRGVLGHALKRTVCALHRNDCADCLLRSQCLYVFVFESPPGKTGSPSSPSPLRPYVIEPPLDVQTAYAKGNAFVFHLLLFGKANDCLPYFIYAFDQVGKIGIGKKIGGKRPGFSLDSVSANGARIYGADTGRIEAGVFTEALQTAPIPDQKETKRIHIRLLTPLRVKYANHLKADLPFHILIRAALRRAASLGNAFGEGEPDLDYRGLVARAGHVKTTNSDLRWFDWQRYSNRQDQAMLMGGILGDLAYQGDLEEFMPLLRFCEKTHLGKQTSFGLGKIEIS